MQINKNPPFVLDFGPQTELIMVPKLKMSVCEGAHAQLSFLDRSQKHFKIPNRVNNLNTVVYLYTNWWITRSEWKGSVTYGLGSDIYLPQWLGTGISNLAHKSNHWAEISGNIDKDSALATCPEVLISCIQFAHAQFPRILGYSVGSTKYKTITRARFLNTSIRLTIQYFDENLFETFSVLNCWRSLN